VLLELLKRSCKLLFLLPQRAQCAFHLAALAALRLEGGPQAGQRIVAVIFVVAAAAALALASGRVSREVDEL
jgi:hypothetical protein